MKKVLLFAVLCIALVSCSDSATKNEMYALNADWRKSTASLEEYSKDMQGTYARCNALRDTMALPTGSLQKLTVANRAKVETDLKNMSDYHNDLIDIGRALSPFFRDWQEKTERLSKLSIVIRTGNQLDNKDIPTEMADLQAEVKNADTTIKDWSEKLHILKTKMEAAYSEFKQQSAVNQ